MEAKAIAKHFSLTSPPAPNRFVQPQIVVVQRLRSLALEDARLAYISHLGHFNTMDIGLHLLETYDEIENLILKSFLDNTEVMLGFGTTVRDHRFEICEYKLL